MKSRLVRIIVVVLVYNLSLVVLTAVLSLQATVQHPMQGSRVASGEYQMHVIDSAVEQNQSDAQSLQSDAQSLQSAGEESIERTAQPSRLAAANNETTFVLIHGASTSALDFGTNLQPWLAQHGRVISIDRPGHGYSDRGLDEEAADPAYQARMILDTLDTLGVRDPVLIGHSWAGAVVMAALLSEHDTVNVRAGVLIAGVSHPWTGDYPVHVELSAYPVIGDVFVWQYISPLGRLSMQSAVESVFLPEQVPDNYIDDTGLNLSLRPQIYQHNAHDRVQLSDYLKTQSLRYPEITTPLLSIAASEDTVVPAWNHHERLLKQIPQTQGLILEGAGHVPHHTRTEVVADAILSFTQSLESND